MERLGLLLIVALSCLFILTSAGVHLFDLLVAVCVIWLVFYLVRPSHHRPWYLPDRHRSSRKRRK